MRASSEILMVEDVNTYELPSEWISPSSYRILSGFGSVTGDRSPMGNRDNSPKQRGLMLDERSLTRPPRSTPRLGCPCSVPLISRGRRSKVV